MVGSWKGIIIFILRHQFKHLLEKLPIPFESKYMLNMDCEGLTIGGKNHTSPPYHHPPNTHTHKKKGGNST